MRGTSAALCCTLCFPRIPPTHTHTTHPTHSPPPPSTAVLQCVQVEDQWYEVQDLRVGEVLPQMVALSETYLQVYELKAQ